MKSSTLSTVFVCIFSFCILLSCDSKKSTEADPDPIIITITDSEHHLGDNQGSEGLVFADSFDISQSFDSATLTITFLYPNDAGQSGPEYDTPPEIEINNTKVGLSPADFPDDPNCKTTTEYNCDVTIILDVTDELVVGNNLVKVISAYDEDDDFVFTDLIVELE